MLDPVMFIPRLQRAALACVTGLVCLACTACGSGTVSAPRPAVHPSRVGPSTMFTPATEIIANPAGTLDELKRLGVDTVHIYLHWADIAPDPASRRRPVFATTDPSAYPASGWLPYDAIVRDASARGINVDLALVSPPPLWAAGPGVPAPAVSHPYWRPSATEYGQFVRAVATRYNGRYKPAGASQPLPRVDFWSIWNEPNLGIELAPEAMPHSQVEVSGYLYRGLVDAAWTALHDTGHGHDTILIGEIAPAGATFGDAPGLFAAMAPLRFLRALYCVDASYHPLRGQAAQARHCPTTASGSATFRRLHPGLFAASGFADHPYPQGLPPNEPTPGEPDYTELADVHTLEHALDAMQSAYGSTTRYPIFSTEFGYQTTPPDQEGGTVSPAQAAVYLNWSEYLTWLDPRLRTYDQYLLLDSPRGNFATGLKFAGGRLKPTYAAFRLPIFLPVRATARGHALEVWGCVRAAYDARIATHHRQLVRIQFSPASGSAFATVATVPITGRFGYVDVLARFPGSGTVRLAWAYPGGPQITSRTVSITLR